MILIVALGIAVTAVIVSFDRFIGPYVDAWLSRHALEDPSPTSLLDTLDRRDT